MSKPILAIETSGARCAAAVRIDEKTTFEIDATAPRRCAEKIATVVERALELAEAGFEDLGAVAVSSGPGSFTGLRIGMSFAKGVAFAKNLPIVPVPTLEAIASEILPVVPDGAEFAVANRAGSQDAYLAAFRKDGNIYKFVDSPTVVGLDELATIPTGAIFFGDRSPSGAFAAPRASTVAEWAARFGKERATGDADFLEPNYLKDFIVKKRKKKSEQ
jgi:tRNA threonylcarbamoyladenosine biosynthesis protein TsaB